MFLCIPISLSNLNILKQDETVIKKWANSFAHVAAICLQPLETGPSKLLSQLTQCSQLRSHKRRNLKPFCPFGANQQGGWGAQFPQRDRESRGGWAQTGTLRYYRPGRMKWHWEKEKLDLPKPAPSRVEVTEWHNLSWKNILGFPSRGFPLLNPFQTLLYQMSCPHSTVQICDTDQLNINASAIISWVLSEKVWLLGQEILALAPEVRRHFKETTIAKRLPALPSEAQPMAAHMVSNLLIGCQQDIIWLSWHCPFGWFWGYIRLHNHGYRNHRQQLPGHDYP